MKERIQQLAEQAKFMAEEDINRQISYNTELKAFAEKFAELIVQECAEVITETRWHLPPTQQQIAVGIKEHFGVEE
jgi:hypothetical protein